MAAVTPQTILYKLARYYPAGSSVKPPPRKAAGTLCVSRESVVEKVFRAEKVVQPENELRIESRLEKWLQSESEAKKVSRAEKVVQPENELRIESRLEKWLQSESEVKS